VAVQSGGASPRNGWNRHLMVASEGPTVSVVIPVYNQAHYLPTAIRSVLAQDYRPLEVIVVDDGSTDAIDAAVAPFRDHIRCIRQDNHGAAHALNEGISRATGDLVCWLSADDAYLPGKLRAQVDAFGVDADLALVCTGYEVVDARDRVIRRQPKPHWPHPDPLIAVFWRNPINGSTVMLRREVFDAVGQFDETLRADVDADMWLRIASNHRVRQVDGIFVRYRMHAASLSANRSLMRASMTRVRALAIANGTLMARLRAGNPRTAPRLLALMSAEYASRGLHDLALDLYRASRSEGRTSIAQPFAWFVLLLTRWTAGRGLAVAIVGSARRRLWRMRETMRRPR
jgi:teichuronic acid biosynthesis glycosyltransferase TuaG